MKTCSVLAKVSFRWGYRTILVAGSALLGLWVPAQVARGTPLFSPDLTTTADPSIVELGTSPNIVLKDDATLSGGSNPTGSIVFKLSQGAMPPIDTEMVTVNMGNGTYETPTGFTLPTTGNVAGTYEWNVMYTGDANNNAATALTESVTVLAPGSVPEPSTFALLLGSVLACIAAIGRCRAQSGRKRTSYTREEDRQWRQISGFGVPVGDLAGSPARSTFAGGLRETPRKSSPMEAHYEQQDRLRGPTPRPG